MKDTVSQKIKSPDNFSTIKISSGPSLHCGRYAGYHVLQIKFCRMQKSSDPFRIQLINNCTLSVLAAQRQAIENFY